MVSRTVDNEQGRQLDDVDLRGVFTTIRKYKLAIVLCTSALTLLVTLILAAITPVYRATSTLLINPTNTTKLVSVEELVQANKSSNEHFLTQIEMLRSRKLAQRVVNSLGI